MRLELEKIGFEMLVEALGMGVKRQGWLKKYSVYPGNAERLLSILPRFMLTLDEGRVRIAI